MARRVGWILLGTAGVPSILIGLAYLIGVPIAIAAIVLGRLVANVEGVIRALFVLHALVFLWGMITVVVNRPSRANQWILGVVLSFSVFAALISLSKLGMMLGRGRKTAL